jgi:hypothetical protein
MIRIAHCGCFTGLGPVSTPTFLLEVAEARDADERLTLPIPDIRAVKPGVGNFFEVRWRTHDQHTVAFGHGPVIEIFLHNIRKGTPKCATGALISVADDRAMPYVRTARVFPGRQSPRLLMGNKTSH